jgi:hypothetical protein
MTVHRLDDLRQRQESEKVKRKKGEKESILFREMGVVDALRFLSQFRSGSEDYTREHGQWLDDLSLEQIAAGINHAGPTAKASGKSCSPLAPVLGGEGLGAYALT